ncbi:hypothetical protein ACVPPR_07840 [Dellaglioa sp. L3N]
MKINKYDWTVVIVIAIGAMYLASKYHQPLLGLISLVLAILVRHYGWDTLFKDGDDRKKKRSS